MRVKDITAGRIGTSNPMRVSPDVSARHAKTALRGGELLLTIVGSVGNAAVVPADLAGWNVARAIAVIRPQGVSAEWLRIAFESTFVRAQVDAALNTTVQATLNLADLKRVRIPLPKEDEQRAIAEVLGALDDKIAANTKLAATAHELAGVEYARATTGVESVAMSKVLTPVLGGTPARSQSGYWGGRNLWVSARDVTNAPNSVVLDTEEKITDLAATTTRARPLPAGSVILTARGTVGAVARLAEPASFNQSCYGFEPDGTPASVLYFGVLAAAERAKAVAHGSVFDTITLKTFDHLQFPDFVGSEAARLDAVLAPLLAVVESAVRENRILATTRDALLPHLMSGKLRVRDVEQQLRDEEVSLR